MTESKNLQDEYQDYLNELEDAAKKLRLERWTLGTSDMTPRRPEDLLSIARAVRSLAFALKSIETRCRETAVRLEIQRCKPYVSELELSPGERWKWGVTQLTVERIKEELEQ